MGAVRVVLVDDHRMVAESISEALNIDPRIEVIGIATTPAEAHDLVDRAAPSLVVIDYNLGDSAATGIDVIRSLKARHPDTHVIMITSSDSDDVLARAIEAGCAGFVTKHRPIAEIADAIVTVDEGETAISAATLARLLPRFRAGAGQVGRPTGLSSREVEVLNALARGLPTKQVADELFISEKTVRNHTQRILMKLDAHSKLEAVSKAVQQGLIDFPR